MDKRRVLLIIHNSLVVCCYTVISFNLIMSIIALIPGLEYNLNNKTLWLICSSALLIATSIVDGIFQYEGKKYLYIHLLAYPAIFILFIGATGINLFGYLLMIVVLSISGYMFIKSKASRNVKIIIEIFTVLLAVPTLIFFSLGILIGDFGSITIQSHLSPNGAYEAELRISDEGALGGRTFVTVYKTGTHVSMPFGTFSHPLKQYQTGWISPDEAKVLWENDDTIIVDDYIWHWQEE